MLNTYGCGETGAVSVLSNELKGVLGAGPGWRLVGART